MRSNPLSSHAPLAVLAPFALGILLTGCGSDDSDQTSPKESPTTAHSSAKPSTTPTSSTSRSESPSPTKAADGTDLSSCVDGTCEVEIKVGDIISVDSDSGRKEFRLDGLGAEGQVVAVGPFDNPMTTTVNGGVEINGVSLELTPLSGKRAIAKVSS